MPRELFSGGKDALELRDAIAVTVIPFLKYCKSHVSHAEMEKSTACLKTKKCYKTKKKSVEITYVPFGLPVILKF